MATEAQRRATAKYDKANTRFVGMKLNLTTDADILDWLAEQDNIQGYLKSVIRADIARKSVKNPAVSDT